MDLEPEPKAASPHRLSAAGALPAPNLRRNQAQRWEHVSKKRQLLIILDSSSILIYINKVQ
jgi:hypothetical protein